MTSRSLARPIALIVTSHRQREGAGFIVRRPFPGPQLALMDPFLLLDEMGPIEHAPATKGLGAPDHPHRGFETVTYILEGEAEHEDSAGNRGLIGTGDVQWMTAGRGVVHSEMPSRRFQERGGRMHGFQIWVNLPAKDKMIEPRYQGIPSAELPTGKSEDGLSSVKVIAGEALGARAVIETRTPIVYQDWTLSPGARVTVPLEERFSGGVYVFGGIETDAPAVEDWGWYSSVIGVPVDAFIGIGRVEDDEYVVFFEPKKDRIFRWYRFIDARPLRQRLCNALLEIFGGDPDIELDP